MKIRNLDYELKFKKYLYSFDFETHKKVCKTINLKHNTITTEKEIIKQALKEYETRHYADIDKEKQTIINKLIEEYD